MFLLPYETTTCQRLYKTASKDIINKIKRAELDLKLPAMQTPNKHPLKQAVYVSNAKDHDEIMGFTQYVNIGDAKESILAIDGRHYMTLDKDLGLERLVKTNDWRFQCVRLSLNNVLLKGDNEAFSRLTDLPCRLFFRWVSAILTKKYSLHVSVQTNLWVICCFYYMAMIYPDLRDPGDARLLQMDVVADATGIALDTVSEIAQKLGKMHNAQDLCDNIVENAGTLQLGKLSDTALFILAGSSWYGVQGRENIQVAMEHIPTWIAIVFAAIDDRTYNKSDIAIRLESAARRGEKESFVDLVSNVIDKYYQ